jgi:DNA gyrase subunit A
MAETIHAASIVEETRRRYLTYALSVIQSRALPDVRDGLKPVQRRILYTMYHDLHLYADEKHRKCAKITGDVMGNYHPHGDQAIYDALVRMAQDFVMRFPLIEGQGNFGSVSGLPAASYRYTEARLTVPAEHLMAELRQRTVDLRDNYDATQHEPVVLPAQFPNLLVNGSSGIAVGMATNIPPHNLGDVLRASILLIDDPEASVAQLLDKLKGPDFPLGGKVVTDRTTLRKIYEEGTGSIKIQGEWKLEIVGKREQLVIHAIPYGVNVGDLVKDIAEIIVSRQLPQLTEVMDGTNKKVGIHIVLEMKPGTDPNVIMAYLYKHTALQSNFAYNMTCLVPGPDATLQPRRGISLKEVLRHFLDFRLATVRRRFEFELEQLRKRIHILDGFRIIFNALDEAIKIIRDSKGKQDAAEKLRERFRLDEIQADAVLDAQLYKIAQLEIKKILDELKEKKAEAARIEGILASEKKLWNVIKTELNELGEKFSERRRTRIASAEDLPEFDPEAYIVRENANVVLTRDGWIKRVGRLSLDEGGKITTRVREGDEILTVVPGNTLDHVIFCADDGTAYTMRINEVPASSGYGEPIAKFFRLDDKVRIVHAVTTDPRFIPEEQPGARGDPPGPYLLVVTAQGQTLRTPLAPYRVASTKVGRRYVRLEDGDRVVMATVLRDETTIFLAAASGHVIHFPIDQINILSGVGKGVIGIKLDKGDVCLGGAVISKRTDKLEVETNKDQRMEFHMGRETTARGGKGFEAVKRSSFVRIIPPPIELVNWDEIEGKTEKEPKPNGNSKNGEQPMLFD